MADHLMHDRYRSTIGRNRRETEWNDVIGTPVDGISDEPSAERTISWGRASSRWKRFDATANPVALDSPYDVAAERQIVPLRPHIVRIGVDASF